MKSCIFLFVPGFPLPLLFPEIRYFRVFVLCSLCWWRFLLPETEASGPKQEIQGRSSGHLVTLVAGSGLKSPGLLVLSISLSLSKIRESKPGCTRARREASIRQGVEGCVQKRDTVGRRTETKRPRAPFSSCICDREDQECVL